VAAARLALAVMLLLPAAARASSLWYQENPSGQHDYGRQLVIPAGFGAGEFTFELWIKPDQSYPVGPVSGGTDQLRNWSNVDNPPYSALDWWYSGNFLLDGHNNNSFTAGTFSLQFYGGGRVRWLFGDGEDAGFGSHWSVGAYPASSTPSLLDGAWHQLTLVRRWSGPSSSQLELWVDGALVDTETSPARTDMRTYWNAWAGFPAGQEGWFWGAEKQAAIGVLSQYEDYKGLLDEMRFWSRAKSPAEIQNGWRAAASPGSTGLVGLYRFSEGSGTTTCSAITPAQCQSLVAMRPGYWSTADAPLGAGTSLRYYGNGAFEENQVKIRLDAPPVPADVGAGDFTVEFWMKALPGENTRPACQGGGSDWINGDIAIDRDVFGNGDYGDYGMSVANGRVSFGVGGDEAGGGYYENTVCGTRPVADGSWHHVALVRSAAGAQIRVYVDGQLDAQGRGPSGDASYRNGRATSWPNSDPYLVIGAEKHFGAEGWTAFSGWIDEVRLSNVARYSANFAVPTAPFTADASTAALYHFDEGGGDVIGDSAGAAGGPSPGVRRFGGSPAGPVWSTDTPFFTPPSPTRFYTLPPCRLADTRNPVGPSGGPALGANSTRNFPVTGLCNVPSTAVAVVLNATAVGPTDSGNLRLFAQGGALPNASALNFAAGRTRANNAVVPLGAGGGLGVRCDMAPGSSGSTHFVLDVTGYFQ
jgi:hypothetical protein